VLGPQRFWHHVDGGVGLQHELPDVQTPPSGHVAGHATDCPQLFITLTLHLPEHAPALSGVQHVSSVRQKSPLFAHEGVPFAPQPTDSPQLFVFVPQFLPAQVVVTGSGTQPSPPSGRGPASVPPSPATSGPIVTSPGASGPVTSPVTVPSSPASAV